MKIYQIIVTLSLIFFILTTTFIEEKRLVIEKPKSDSEQAGQKSEIKIAIDKNNSLPQKDIDEYGRINRIELSAKTGQGIEFLKEALVGRASAFNNQEIINYDENFK